MFGEENRCGGDRGQETVCWWGGGVKYGTVLFYLSTCECFRECYQEMMTMSNDQLLHSNCEVLKTELRL